MILYPIYRIVLYLWLSIVHINYIPACICISYVSFLFQIAILIDTSSSIASRLFLVKDKLYRLMQVSLYSPHNRGHDNNDKY